MLRVYSTFINPQERRRYLLEFIFESVSDNLIQKFSMLDGRYELIIDCLAVLYESKLKSIFVLDVIAKFGENGVPIYSPRSLECVFFLG